MNFTYDPVNQGWTAQAFFDGDADRAPSQSNIVQFSVGD